MDHLAPVGPVYQAGTLSGNPVAVAAARATLNALTADVYTRLEQIGSEVEAGIQDAVAYHGCSMHRVGSMFTVFFRPEAPMAVAEVQECDFEGFGRFFRGALSGGVYLPPSQYEAAFLSSRLSDADVRSIVVGLEAALVASLT